MQTQQYYNFINELLKEQKIGSKKITKRLKSSVAFQNLERSGIIKPEKALNGGFNYVVCKQDELIKHFKSKFPNPVTETANSISNIKTFKDSKARKRQSNKVVLLRGNQKINVNGENLDLAYHTKHFGLFSVKLQSISANKICIVENLDTFLIAEKIISGEYLFLHSYGRLGRELLNSIRANELLVFSDYDYTGLKEYLLVKSVFETAQFYLPENYDNLFNESAKTLKKKNGGGQKPTKAILESSDKVVEKIREQLLKTGKFLEQQALFEE